MYKLIALDSTDKEVIIDDKISDSYHDKHPEAAYNAQFYPSYHDFRYEQIGGSAAAVAETETGGVTEEPEIPLGDSDSTVKESLTTETTTEETPETPTEETSETETPATETETEPAKTSKKK